MSIPSTSTSEDPQLSPVDDAQSSTPTSSVSGMVLAILGGTVLLVGVVLGLIGLYSSDDASKQQQQSTKLRVLRLDTVKQGTTRGRLTAEVGANVFRAPLTGKRVAWWQKVTIEEWEESYRDCSGSSDNCTTRSRTKSEVNDVTSSRPSIEIRGREESRRLVIPASRNFDSDGDHPTFGSLHPYVRTRDMGTFTDRKMITQVYTLSAGRNVTLLGDITRTDTAIDVRRVGRMPAIHLGSWSGYQRHLTDQAGTAKLLQNIALWLLAGGGLVGIAGAFLLWSSRSAQRSSSLDRFNGSGSVDIR